MGIFSNMFKREQKKEQSETAQYTSSQQNSSNASFSRDALGNIVVEYYDNKATATEFYDTTKLVIDPIPTQIEGKMVSSAKIAWYNESDAFYIDKDGTPLGSRYAFVDIKLEIDNQRLFQDPNYQRVLMTQLLDRKRVEYKYIPAGLEENPDVPCGNYVGAVGENYSKQFSNAIGRAVHSSPEMVEKRQRYLAEKEKARQAQLSKKQEELRKLQAEIDGLSK